MDEKIFDLIEKMYVEMQNGFKKVDERFVGVENSIEGIDSRIEGIDRRIESIDGRLSGLEDKVTNINITLEHEIKPQLKALFDEYKQNSDKLDRIEKEVSKHEEIILRRIK